MATFEEFERSLVELTEAFRSRYYEVRQIDEANLRLEYIDQFFTALGWDIGNRQRQIPRFQDVIVEPPGTARSGRKRPDYLFQSGGIPKFICEAKRPNEVVDRHYFQIQNYVYNARLWLGVLTNFEEIVVFVVGGKPSKDKPFRPPDGWRLYYEQNAVNARKIWDLLAKENVDNGSIERFAESLPKIPQKGKQGWLLRPDRNRSIDNDFLGYLEEQRKHLAHQLVIKKERNWTSAELTEATQRILDRLLFQRICEDRNIDVNRTLERIYNEWDERGRKTGQLWPMAIGNFNFLRNTFNGDIFGKPNETTHFIHDISVPD